MEDGQSVVHGVVRWGVHGAVRGRHGMAGEGAAGSWGQKGRGDWAAACRHAAAGWRCLQAAHQLSVTQGISARVVPGFHGACAPLGSEKGT